MVFKRVHNVPPWPQELKKSLAWIEAFKAAHLLCPATVRTINPVPESVRALRQFPFLDNDHTIGRMIDELPFYPAAAEDVKFDVDSLAAKEQKKVDWWRDHANVLPNWAAAAKQVLLVPPSSAAAERAFLLLKATFNDQRLLALQDYIETLVMLRYNRRSSK